MVVKQIKYYDEDNKRLLNNPKDITAEQLVAGTNFEAVVCKEILIKTHPGTIVRINGEVVQIGEVGVYNILYRENTEITSLSIDADSIEFIKNTDSAYFIITFIQED